MNKQINFFLTSEDWQKVKIYCQKQLWICVDEKGNILTEIPLNTIKLCYFILPNAKLAFFDFGKIDIEKSEAIEISTGSWNENTKYAFRGRFFYGTQFIENDTFVEKSEEFLKSARNFFSWFKRTFQEMEINNTFYIGKKLHQWVQDKEATIQFQ